jgi:Tfp pilus assembly protein PilF
MQNGQYAEAVSTLKRAVELAPRDTDAHAWLGHAHLSGGHLVESAEAYKRAIEIDPRNIDALNGLGEIARRGGKYPEARKWFEQATTASPNDALSKYNLAKTLVLMQQFAAAEKALRECTVLSPSRLPSKTTLEVWIDLGALLFNSENYREAEMALRHALDIVPEDPVATHNLALVLASAAASSMDSNEAATMLAQAEALFRTGIASSPSSAKIHRNFALFLIYQDRLEEAESVLRIGLRLAPNDGQSARLLARLERFKELRAQASHQS